MDKKNNKIQCSTCLGIGLIKTHYKICRYCDGNKCIMCNSTGLSVMPWSKCAKCDGLGEVEI
jgi:DnaJ-class molecular chaperone